MSPKKAKWTFGEGLKNSKRNLKRIRIMIKYFLWCPPPCTYHGVAQCGLCEQDIDFAKHEGSFYAVWCGLICNRCSRLYEREIEELSQL